MIVRNSPFPPINTTNATDRANEANRDATSTQSASETQENDKVSDIKERVENGTYKIDIGKTADKMAQELLLEMRVFR